MNKIKFLSLCFATVGFIACESDEAIIETEDVGAYAYPDNSITVLDRNEELSIDLFSDGAVQFESITIEDADGATLTSPSISGDVATYNASTLGDYLFGEDNDEPTGSYDVRIVSQLSNGQVLRDFFTIGVGHAISVSGVDEVPFDASEIEEDADTTINYAVNTYSAPVDSFTLEWKIGSEATYAADDISLSTEGGAIDLATMDRGDYSLNPGDTLYYRFTATNGELMDQIETSTVFTETEEEAEE